MYIYVFLYSCVLLYTSDIRVLTVVHALTVVHVHHGACDCRWGKSIFTRQIPETPALADDAHSSTIRQVDSHDYINTIQLMFIDM